jgi:hypothetical protein
LQEGRDEAKILDRSIMLKFEDYGKEILHIEA